MSKSRVARFRMPVVPAIQNPPEIFGSSLHMAVGPTTSRVPPNTVKVLEPPCLPWGALKEVEVEGMCTCSLSNALFDTEGFHAARGLKSTQSCVTNSDLSVLAPPLEHRHARWWTIVGRLSWLSAGVHVHIYIFIYIYMCVGGRCCSQRNTNSQCKAVCKCPMRHQPHATTGLSKQPRPWQQRPLRHDFKASIMSAEGWLLLANLTFQLQRLATHSASVLCPISELSNRQMAASLRVALTGEFYSHQHCKCCCHWQHSPVSLWLKHKVYLVSHSCRTQPPWRSSLSVDWAHHLKTSSDLTGCYRGRLLIL